jgi:hypothetical protein
LRELVAVLCRALRQAWRIGGPWGAAAGALFGGLTGGFGGGGGGDALEYGLTPREEELQQYAFDQTKAPPEQKRKID